MLPTASEHPVEAVLAIPLLIIGLSHIFQPAMWRDFFKGLHAMGPSGVILRVFALEFWSAAIIVAFHQEWTWPGVVLTAYGHVLMVKIIFGLLAPNLGLKSLAMAETHGVFGLIIAGIFLCLLAALCIVRLVL